MTADGYIISAEYVTVRLEPSHYRARLGVEPQFWQQDLARQRHVVLISVLAMLQGLGHYSLHASGLVTDGRAVLASGPSGSGKTTLALSLLAQGWHYLSDDVTLLSVSDENRGGSVLAKTLTRGFSCTDDTLERFSHLADVPVLFRNAKDKRVIDIARHYPSRVAHEAPVGLILFPQVARTTTTRLERLEPAQALLRLLPQTAGVKQRSQQVLEHLSALVKQAPAFALYLGYDLYHYPERVAEQIRGALTDES